MTFATTANNSDFVVKAQLQTQVKIMPLGDSITVGISGIPGLDGYRKSLFMDLSNSGFNVDFVGSQMNGTGLDNDNEGHSGFEANQISDNVVGWLNDNPADIVLLHIGTNDIDGGQGAVDVVSEVSGILDKIDQWGSVHGQVTVVLARIILRVDSASFNDTTKSFDDALQTMAQVHISNGDNIVVVDMENALSYSTDMSPDGIHPNLAGYEKMADVWYNALVKIMGFSLTVNYVGQGLVSKMPAQIAYPNGAIVNLTAFADPGWAFTSWSGDLNGSANSENITMNTNKTVTAIFSQMYKLTISANHGTTTPPAGDHWYVAGTNVTISASPPTESAGERFSWLNWTGAGFSSYNGPNNTIVVTMNSSVTESAFWKHEYKLTLSSNPGTTTPSIGEHWYEAGTPVTVTALPPTQSEDTRNTWAGWTGSGTNSYTGSINPIVVTMNSPVTQSALWNIDYKLTITTNLGTTQPLPGEYWFSAGTAVSVETTPPLAQTGVQYVCLGWTGTGSVTATGNNSNIEFIINSPSTISWTWKTQYYLTVISTYGTTSGAGWYDSDTSAHAAISPTNVIVADGIQYAFSGWSGNASGSASTSNPILMDNPKTATATWSYIQPSTPTPSPLPSPSPSPKITPSPSPTSLNTPTPTVSASPFNKPTATTPQDNFGYYPYFALGIGITSIAVIFSTIVLKKKKRSLS